MGDTDLAEWAGALQQFLYEHILSKIIDNDAERKRLLGGEAMTLFMSSFIHESYNPNFNYERLETVGDKVLKAVFPLYLIQKVTGLTSNDISNLDTFYMSKPEQNKIAVKLGLGPYILSRDTKVGVSILEDVFEALCGALYEVAAKANKTKENTPNVAAGVAVVHNFIVYIFETIFGGKIDMKKAEGNSITFVGQFVHQMVGKNFNPIDGYNAATGLFTVTLPKQMSDLLKIRGIDLKDPTIGSAQNMIKKTAKHAAYEASKETLSALGITRDWIIDQKQIIRFHEPEVMPLVEPLYLKAKNEDYARPMFVTIGDPLAKPVRGAILAFRENDLRVLSQGQGETLALAKINAIQNYLDGKQLT